MQIRFDTAAEADLAEARLWYSRQCAGLDLQLMLRVDETLLRIVKTPYLYPRVYRQLRRAVLRQFPLAIFYDVVNDEIRVFAVYHTRRDRKQLTSRLGS